MEMVTPTWFAARNSMISGFSSVAFVVRLKSTSLPISAARCRAYAMVFFNTGKFSSVSPPKNVTWAIRLLPDSFSMKSTLWRAVSSFMKRGLVLASTILSSPYS